MGGFLRDLLLERPSRDVDLVCPAGGRNWPGHWPGR
nr:hypothetical protein [Desulfofundulus thermosubterraneus]